MLQAPVSLDDTGALCALSNPQVHPAQFLMLTEGPFAILKHQNVRRIIKITLGKVIIDLCTIFFREHLEHIHMLFSIKTLQLVVFKSEL